MNNTHDHPLKKKKEDRVSSSPKGGRPKEWDKEAIEKALIEWIEQPDSNSLCGFSAKYKIDPDLIMDFADECPSFHRTYNFIKATIGHRREIALSEGTLHPKAYDLNVPVYNKFLRKERRDEKLFDAEIQKDMLLFMQKLKEKEIETVSQEVKDQYESLMSQITAFQEKKKNAARYQKSPPKAK
jgi:hypothetical protein